MVLFSAGAAVALVAFATLVLPAKYTPGHVWSYAWAFAWACQAVLGTGYLLDWGTAVFVAACNLAFLFAAYLAVPAVSRVPGSSPTGRVVNLGTGSRARLVTCVACLMLAVLSLQIGLRQIGHPGLNSMLGGSYSQFSDSLRVTKSNFSVNGVWVTPTAITVSATLLVAASVLAGLEVAVARNEARWRARLQMGAVLVLAFVTSASTGVRSYLLITIFMVLGTYLATKVFVVGVGFSVSGRAAAGGAAAVAGFLVWVVVVQSARRGDMSFERVGATLDYLRAWFAGYMPALSQWSADVDPSGGGFGENLSRGVLVPLGLARGEGFGEQVEAVAIGDGGMSNAMTVFRVLLLDFGFPGALIACVVAGFVSQRVYLRVVAGSIGWVVPLAAVYAAALYSFNGWFFAYGSRIGGVVLAAVVMWATVRPTPPGGLSSPQRQVATSSRSTTADE
ncbi:O-antigen polymerase [Nocardioides soli]|uniref:Oligosaccharide repeat unit polymerase n=1 Tax=Nocardioides soli TaxID=1036020 RepID=A0A7W4Z0T7_9ACTN|nr:O-antigen polymerase [Nocardioides soli]MBB3042242.1 oligosaccharide repeat unit polymerase [Nocardioides soli]